MRGKLACFSVEKMLGFLTALGRDITIIVTEAAIPEEPGEITVAVCSATGRLHSVTGGTDGTLTAEPIAAANRETRHRRRVTPSRRSSIALQ